MRMNDVIRILGGSVAVYMVVAACSGSGSDSSASADDNANGTRLKVQHYVGADGSSFTAGRYDSMLGTPCGYGTASDGSVRCLPTATNGSFEPAIGGVELYADSACTVMVVFPSTSCASVPKFTSVGLSCGVEVYEPTVQSGSLFTRGTGGCVEAPSSATMGKTPYVQGAALPPSTFVAGTLTTDS